MDFQMQPGNGNELGIRSSKDAPATRRHARVSFIAPDSCEGLIASYRLSLRPPPGVAVTALKHDGVGLLGRATIQTKQSGDLPSIALHFLVTDRHSPYLTTTYILTLRLS